jgi:hypothetical protein
MFQKENPFAEMPNGFDEMSTKLALAEFIKAPAS